MGSALLHVPIAGCGVLGLLLILGRLWGGRRSPAQWLALVAFSAWSLGAGLEVAWPWLAHAGVAPDLRNLLVGWLRVLWVLAVALVLTTFGIRMRLRAAFVLGAIGAGLLVWWLPGHGVLLPRSAQPEWTAWAGTGLYLGYFAAVWGLLLDVGDARYRIELPLPKQVQVRLLQTLAVAALTHVGAQGLVVVGVQVGWPGFSPAAAAPMLDVLRLFVALIFWLALAPPDAWLRGAALIEATEARAFAVTFALQTKEDAGRGRDLCWRTELVALAEQVARAQGLGFDEVAHVRLAAALLHTEFEVRATSEPADAVDSSQVRSDASARRQGVHSLVARTVWVPPAVRVALREVGNAMPRCRIARVLRVIDRYLRLTDASDFRDVSAAGSVRALSKLDQDFPGWPEVHALRHVVRRHSGP